MALAGMNTARYAVLVMILLGVWPAGQLSAQNRAELEEGPVVTVAPAKITTLEKRVALSGSLVAKQEVAIFPQVAGHAVTDLLADVGDRVEAGQVLAQLQDGILRGQLAQAQAEHERAQAGVKQAESQIRSTTAALNEAVTALERTRQLRQSGNISQAGLDQAVTAEATARGGADSAQDGLSVAQATLAQADAALMIAQLNLDFAQITSPVDGIVTARNVNLGDLAGSSALPMFTVITDGEIELAAEVIETAVPELRVDALVELEVAGIGPVEGRIRLLPASVDPTTRLGTLRVSLANDSRLRPGLYASGWIVLEKREALSVPTTAVLSDEDGEGYVQLVADGGVVETRPVVPGLIWQGRREVSDGLTEGDQVMVRAGAFFREGDRVRPAPTGDGDRP